MNTLFAVFNNIQTNLFPWLEEELDPLSDKEQQFVRVIALLDLQKHMHEFCGSRLGRKCKSRNKLASVVCGSKTPFEK